MGNYAYLEIDTDGLQSIRDVNGLNVGKPLMAFLGVYQSVISRAEESPELTWFRRFEKQTRAHLRVLTEIYYGEDMLYLPDEYPRFMAEWGALYGDISEEEFKQKLREVENLWSPIDEIILAVQEVIRLLPEMGDDTYWFTPIDTQPAFQGLLNTLIEAQNQGGEKVRILIR